jgi:hypothetical protein
MTGHRHVQHLLVRWYVVLYVTRHRCVTCTFAGSAMVAMFCEPMCLQSMVSMMRMCCVLCHST